MAVICQHQTTYFASIRSFPKLWWPDKATLNWNSFAAKLLCASSEPFRATVMLIRDHGQGASNSLPLFFSSCPILHAKGFQMPQNGAFCSTGSEITSEGA